MPDMKGDGPDTADEFLHKLSLREDFSKDLLRARKILRIPQEGFPDKETEKAWDGNGLELLETWMDLMKIYKIPVPYQLMLHDYLFFNKATHHVRSSVLVVDYPSFDGEVDLEELYKGMEEPYAKVLIFKNATKSAVLKDIKKNWQTIAGVLNILGPKKKRIRETKYKEQNKLIHDLWLKSPSALREELAKLGIDLPPKLYKENLIQRILTARGYRRKDKKGNEKEISIEVIKKLASLG